MIPRALRSPVRAMARPSRPPAEGAAVRAAAALVREETAMVSADPIAGIIAQRVVEKARAYLAEDMDPLLAALGDLQRRIQPCPYDTLATDPAIDTISMFVDARVARLSARCGRGLPPREDEAECSELWAKVQATLWRRYLKALRTTHENG